MLQHVLETARVACMERVAASCHRRLAEERALRSSASAAKACAAAHGVGMGAYATAGPSWASRCARSMAEPLL